MKEYKFNSSQTLEHSRNSFKMVDDNGFLVPNSQGVAGQSDTNGIINNATWLYYSNSLLKFTGSLDETETITVNGQQIQVLNNQFSYNIPAPFVNKDNESSDSTNNSSSSSSSKSVSNNEQASYVINIYKSGTLIFTETILVEQGIPNINYKWYAWNPSKKPWQKNI